MTGRDAARRMGVIVAIAGLYVWAFRTVSSSPGSPPISTVPVAAANDRSTLSADDARALVRHVDALMREEKYVDAVAPLQRLLSAFPQNPIYLRHLATAYHALNRPLDEAQAWADFLGSSPTPLEACPDIGAAYQKAGRADQALRAFERCHDLDVTDSDAIFYLALAYERRGDLDRAAALYADGMRQGPSHADLAVGAARVAMFQGRPAEARDRVAAVLGADAENVDALLVMGLAWQRDGNRAKARMFLERGLRLREEYPDFHLALGMIAEEEGRREDARHFYQRAIALDGSRADARQRLARLPGPTP
jgi:tetratricopeptide (TPR) repeat protein